MTYISYGSEKSVDWVYYLLHYYGIRMSCNDLYKYHQVVFVVLHI